MEVNGHNRTITVKKNSPFWEWLQNIFSPWLIIKKLKFALNEANNENISLFNEIERLKMLSISFSSFNDMTHNHYIPVNLNEISGMLHWPEILIPEKRINGFKGLIELFALFYSERNKLNSLSNCWELLAVKNGDQLLNDGYANFKRTIGNNYFNFLVQQGDPQIKAAEALFSETILDSCKTLARSLPHDPTFCSTDQFNYYYFVCMLWEYVKRIDKNAYLDQLEEPKEGNPVLVHSQGKSMSQDLANSLIEYYAIDNAVPFKNMTSVLEIGGGYGRDAFVILSLNPGIRVVLVDILPALYVAQRYLSSIFGDRKIFRARAFTDYSEVKEEMASSSIVFLMPHQLALLPDQYVDLSMNISSFGEMNLDQIKWYFEQINRVTRQYFYTKQWNDSKNPFDGLVLNKKDYPSFSHWKELYSRSCAIQTEFFETLYQVSTRGNVN